MIILITGATHTGKTLLAQKLLETYRYPYLSMDHVKMGLIRTGLAKVSPTDPDEVLMPTVWPVIREIIKTAAENGQNLIVEGCYVPADWERDFPPDYRRQIRFVCLIMTEKYILTCFDEIKNRACVIENRIADEDFTLETALRENARYLSQFGASDGLTLIDADFPTVIENCINNIL